MTNLEWAQHFVGLLLLTGGVVDSHACGVDWSHDKSCIPTGRQYPAAVKMLVDKMRLADDVCSELDLCSESLNLGFNAQNVSDRLNRWKAAK